jgi:hypothetical protein
MPEPGPTPAGTVLPDLEAEARRVLDGMEGRGLEIRLLGGLAIRIALDGRFNPKLSRPHQDIDLITTRSDGSKVETALAELGWEPERQFNALNGARRLLFNDPASEHKLDGFVERFEMCHKLPLVERFPVRKDTLPPADLLLTKLQIIELNAKDRGDCYALLLGFPLASDPAPDVIELPRIAGLAAKDWGLHHTLELNFQRMREGIGEIPFDDSERAAILEAIDGITTAMGEAQKTRAWKVRARIGERKRWYDEPEEID